MKQLALILLGVFILAWTTNNFAYGQANPVVLLLLKDYNNPFFTEIERGFRETMPKSPPYELQVRYGAHEGDISRQRQTIDNFLAKYGTRLKVVAVTPAASNDALVSSIKSLRDHDVAVLIVDARIEKEALERANTDYTLYVGSSNRLGGELGGRLLVECAKENKKNRVLLLNGFAGHETAMQRREGFLTSLKNSNVNYELTERTANWERKEAQDVLDALLTMGKRFDLIFAANDLMALGAAEAVRQLGDENYHPAIVGFDAIDEARQAVKDGRMYATVAQNPGRMGEVAAQAIDQILANNLRLEKDTYLDVEPVGNKYACP